MCVARRGLLFLVLSLLSDALCFIHTGPSGACKAHLITRVERSAVTVRRCVGQSDAKRRTVRRTTPDRPTRVASVAQPCVSFGHCRPTKRRTVRPYHAGPSDGTRRTVRRIKPDCSACTVQRVFLPSVFSCGRFRGSFCVAVPSRVLSLVATS